MKKENLLRIAAVAVLIAAAVLWFLRDDLGSLLPYTARRPAGIPVLSEYDLRYGDGPGAVSGKLGSSLGEREDLEGGVSVYACPAVVLDRPAELSLFFYHNRSLSSVDITINVDSPEAAEALRVQAEARLREAYREYGNFICGKVQNSADGKRQSLALDYGATGVFYTMHSFPDRLSIRCEDLR